MEGRTIALPNRHGLSVERWSASKIQEFRTTGLTVIGSRVVNSLSLGYSVLIRWTFADDVGMMWKASGDPACWTWARLTSRSPT